MKKIAGCSSGKVSGATAFFRNRILFQTIREELALSPQKNSKFLFHSCSVGAEVYSFAISCLMDPSINNDFTIFATDFDDKYLKIAKKGIYAAREIEHLTQDEIKYFERTSSNYFSVKDMVRDKIIFLPQSDFRKFESVENFEVVFVLNSICYVSSEDQRKVINKVSSYNDKLLAVSAVHSKTIMRDVKANNYRPVLNNIEAIHNSWPFRLVEKSSCLDPIKIWRYWCLKKANLYTVCTIPKFKKIRNFEYKYCSIFKKTSSCD